MCRLDRHELDLGVLVRQRLALLAVPPALRCVLVLVVVVVVVVVVIGHSGPGSPARDPVDRLPQPRRLRVGPHPCVQAVAEADGGDLDVEDLVALELDGDARSRQQHGHQVRGCDVRHGQHDVVAVPERGHGVQCLVGHQGGDRRVVHVRRREPHHLGEAGEQRARPDPGRRHPQVLDLTKTQADQHLEHLLPGSAARRRAPSGERQTPRVVVRLAEPAVAGASALVDAQVLEGREDRQREPRSAEQPEEDLQLGLGRIPRHLCEATEVVPEVARTPVDGEREGAVTVVTGAVRDTDLLPRAGPAPHVLACS